MPIDISLTASWLEFDPAWVGGVTRDFDAAIDFAMTINQMTINAVRSVIRHEGSNEMNTRFPIRKQSASKAAMSYIPTRGRWRTSTAEG